jgi:hypothetical protein
MPTAGPPTAAPTRGSSRRCGSISGRTPFERGNLDAGRLSWLFGREVIPAEDPFDPESYEALLQLDVDRARAAFPEAFDGSGIWEGRAP